MRRPGYPYGEFDATIWAREFLRQLHGWLSEPVMVGWFSSALMTGYNRARQPAEPADEFAADPHKYIGPGVYTRAESEKFIGKQTGQPTIVEGPRMKASMNAAPAAEKAAQELLHHHSTGATRSHLARRYDLLPTFLLQRTSRRQELGGQKHGEWNWEKGMPWEDTFNHAIEHLYAWRDEVRKWVKELERETGNDVPPISEDHLAAVVLGMEFLMLWERQQGIECNRDKC